MQNSVVDLAIRIKNGYLAKKEEIVAPYAKFTEEVLKKLKSLGYVGDYKVEGEEVKNILITLIYKKDESPFTDVAIFSKPGRRYYVSYRDLKPVMSGFGHSIISTPAGILTDKEAKLKKTGGELLFNIW